MRLNNRVPVVLGELRYVRRRDRAQVVAASVVLVACLGLLVWPSPWRVLVQAALLAAGGMLLLVRRPCDTCGRWGRHVLTCRGER
jgi:hypothetical protein